MKYPKYKEHIWKCFLLDQDKKVVLGVVSENKHTISYQFLVWRKGRFVSWGTDTQPKRFLKKCNYISTLDYGEAYNFLIT